MKIEKEPPCPWTGRRLRLPDGSFLVGDGSTGYLVGKKSEEDSQPKIGESKSSLRNGGGGFLNGIGKPDLTL